MNDPSFVLVVAPQGAGKTRNADVLCAMFGCTTVVDGWDGVSPVPAGALVLAQPHVILPVVCVDALAEAA